MLRTTRYSRGDIVLVNLLFTDGSGVRRRPAVVLSSNSYHRGRQEAIVAAITSNIQRLLVGDHLISGWQNAGLLFPSVATGIIHTIKQAMIIRRLGVIPLADMRAIEERLKTNFGLV